MPLHLLLRGGLSALPWVFTALAIAGLWNIAIENPRIRRDARSGCIAEATLSAAEATIAEMQRQRDAAVQVADRFRADAQEAVAAHMAERLELEERIADYEKRRAGEGRSCPLTPADLDELRGKSGGGR